MKIGFFEWIASFDKIQSYFENEFLNFETFKNLKVLVIGCGTSQLSEMISLKEQFSEIISTDNDIDCISHMQKQFNNSNVIYCYHDVASGKKMNSHQSLIIDGYFNLIVDKGTFDAIFVGGSISSTLIEISRLLQVNGSYLIFTINSIELFEKLLNINGLNLQISRSSFLSPEDLNENVLLIKKTGPLLIDFDSLRYHEERVMNELFKKENPMFLESELKNIEIKFNSLKNSEDKISIDVVYNIIFSNRIDLGYDFDMFLEDLDNYSKGIKFLSYEQILEFIELMQ